MNYRCYKTCCFPHYDRAELEGGNYNCDHCDTHLSNEQIIDDIDEQIQFLQSWILYCEKLKREIKS